MDNWSQPIPTNLLITVYLLNLCMLSKLKTKKIADFFSKSTFPKISFRNTIRVSKSLDPDQAGHVVGPDLGPNFLQ